MFSVSNCVHTIRRNKTKSIIGILVTGMMVILFQIYIGNMESVAAQLRQLPEVMPVYCYISNLNGTQRTGLEIKGEIYHSIAESEHVKGMKSRLSLLGGIGKFSLEEAQDKLNLSIMAVNDITAFREKIAASVKMERDKDIWFLKENEPYCIVGEGLMEQMDWKIGDTIPLNLYYYQHLDYNGLDIKPLALQEYRIVGSMEETMSEYMEEVQILVPLSSVEALFQKGNIPFYVDALSFYVKNPALLNACKEEMESYSLLPVMPKADFSTDGNALNCKDTTFIAAATALRQQEELLRGFLPMVIAMILAIGYIISTLLMQSRKQEYRLMRMIGLTKGRVTSLFFMEQCILSLCGALIGMAVNFMVWDIQVSVWAAAGGLCISYCLGCLLALMGISRRSIMENRI